MRADLVASILRWRVAAMEISLSGLSRSAFGRRNQEPAADT